MMCKLEFVYLIMPLQDIQHEKLAELCEKHHVESLYLFGSALTIDFDEKKSDIDLLVRFSNQLPLLDHADNYFDLLDKLKELYGFDVDLVSEKSLKNPVLIQEINKTKIPIYES